MLYCIYCVYLATYYIQWSMTAVGQYWQVYHEDAFEFQIVRPSGVCIVNN